MTRRGALALAALALACAAPAREGGNAAVSGTPDAGAVVERFWSIDPSAPADRSAGCVGTFGNALTDAFGRLDGTVVAVVRPKDTQCPTRNDDHVVVEVEAGGAVYRMVVNVKSTIGDPDVRLALPVLAKLPGGAWADGWHPGQKLDYVTDFGLHIADFTPHAMAELSDLVAKALPPGVKVSVFATSTGGTYASGAHLVHRHGHDDDGAIVLEPESLHPKALTFAFADEPF